MMDDLEVSYGWECHVCVTDSVITFPNTDTAVSEAVKHADTNHDGLLTDIDIVEVSSKTDDEND